MGTYSAEWATKIYWRFVELCPRAQQIDACIIQTVREMNRKILTKEDVTRSLIRSLRIKGCKTWTKYKKLVKSPGFNYEQLKQVSLAVLDEWYEVDVEKKQRQFQWD